MSKIDSVEYQRRIFAIQGWILDGAHTSLIVRNIISQGWTSAKKPADQKRVALRILKEARRQWIELEEANLEERRKMKIAELQQLKRTLQDRYRGTPDGIRAVMSIEKEIIKLDGLDPAQRVEISTPKDKPLQIVANVQTAFDPVTVKAINEILSKV